MALVPAVVEAEGILTAPRRVQVCHRDLWSDNVRRTVGGGLVVLDWENSGPGDVNGELGCVVFEYGLGDRDRMRRLYAAYVDAGGPGRLVDRGDLTMLVAQLGHIAQTGCERWLRSSSKEERADNADWVAEFLDEPVTLNVVDDILLAVDGKRRLNAGGSRAIRLDRGRSDARPDPLPIDPITCAAGLSSRISVRHRYRTTFSPRRRQLLHFPQRSGVRRVKLPPD